MSSRQLFEDGVSRPRTSSPVCSLRDAPTERLSVRAVLTPERRPRVLRMDHTRGYGRSRQIDGSGGWQACFETPTRPYYSGSQR